ncbi:MAG: phosphoribosylanthranilate isomerase, partial [Sphaerochaetaceae bacterium]
MTKIKICGIRTPEDVECVNALLPDYAGFVFSEKSRRCVKGETATRLRSLMDRRVATVGVFVDQPEEYIIGLVKNKTIGMIQLHGGEDDAFIEDMRKKTGVPVVKAFGISSRSDFERA